MQTLDLIIPCYNEAPVLPLFYERLCGVLDTLWEYRCRMLFVDDGSSDETLDILKRFALSDERVRYLSFSRNFGKEAAMLCGLQNANADLIAILDADLQHDPALLPAMLEAIREGYDVAAAKRTDRAGENKIKSRLSDLFYGAASRMTQVEIDPGAQDFRVMRRKVAQALLAMPEHRRFTKGLFAYAGFKTKWFEHENAARAAGESKWSLKKLFAYACDGVLGYSDVLLKLPLLFGAVFACGGLLALLVQLFVALFGKTPLSFVHPLLAVLFFFCGTVLLALGVLGAYLARVYTEVKARPLYLVAESNLESPCA